MTPLFVYIHIPFCTVKCGYCDFNAYAGMDALKTSYREALLAEIESYAPLLQRNEVATIGFGGGTPGEVPASHIADVIDAIRSHTDLDPGGEVTLEANPGTASPEYFAALRTGGVSRISLGAQTFDPAHLTFLDRIHSVEAIGASLRGARAAGIKNVNLDLIYGLPGQTLDHWRDQLRQALHHSPDHLSCYALTVEEGTPLHRRVQAGDVVLPDPDALADMYEAAEDLLESAGFHHYELSNWARPGFQSRHNIAYWTDRPYLGIGAGAHGYIDGARYENIAHPREYIAAALAGPGRAPVAQRYHLPAETVIADWVTLRLRLVAGFDPADFLDTFGFPIEERIAPPLNAAVAAGWLEWTPDNIRLTPPGLLLHGELAVRLVDYLDRNPLPSRS
jgi:oxygen-independent coproporphyrinogen III oxidase